MTAQQNLAQRAWVRQIMGMPISVYVRGLELADGLDPSIEAAVEQVFAELRHVDSVFSTYRPDSALNRFTRGETLLSHADSDARRQIREVQRLCERAEQATGGAFSAYLPQPDGERRFDPTGLVKGWAVQRACIRLASALPEHDVMINAGGDIAVSCGRTDTPAWRLGIEDPHDRTQMVGTVELRSGGLATSGTAARGAHLIDPATGDRPTALASVSVAGPSLMWADVYATAAFVKGESARQWLSTLPGYTWLVVDR